MDLTRSERGFFFFFFTTFGKLEWKPILIVFFCFLMFIFKVLSKYKNITIKTLIARSSQIFLSRMFVLLIASDQIGLVHPDPNSSSAGLPR